MRKLGKRIGCFLIAVAILLSFAACKKENSGKIGICLRQTESGVANQSSAALEKAMENAGYQVQILDAGMDQANQLSQLAQLIEAEIDLLVVEPVMVSAGAEIAAMGEAADVPIIFYQQEPEESVLDGWKQLCYVGPAQPGRMPAQVLRQTPDKGDINGDGVVTYLIIGGPEDDLDTRQRSADWVTGLGEAGLEAVCIGAVWGDWSRESGETLAARAIAKYGKDIEVIFCCSDAMAIGALAAIQDGGRTVGKDVYLLGIGGERHALVLIRSGQMTGTVAQDLQAQANRIVELAQALLSGMAVDKTHYTEYVAVTQENVDAFLGE